MCLLFQFSESLVKDFIGGTFSSSFAPVLLFLPKIENKNNASVFKMLQITLAHLIYLSTFHGNNIFHYDPKKTTQECL